MIYPHVWELLLFATSSVEVYHAATCRLLREGRCLIGIAHVEQRGVDKTGEEKNQMMNFSKEGVWELNGSVPSL